MADVYKKISDFPEIGEMADSDLLLLSRTDSTQKMRGAALKQYIVKASGIERAEEAADRAEAAVVAAQEVVQTPPQIGANGNWFVWDNTQKKYVDSGVDASITVEIADVTMLPYGSDAYITNTGTATDPVFHLFIPNAKNGEDGYTPRKGVDYFDGSDGFSPSVNVAEISGGHQVSVTDRDGTEVFRVMDGDSITGITRTDGTGAPGTVDTYTVATSSGGAYQFTVRNGADGKGAGDMRKAIYDPTGKEQDIFAYADAKSGKAVSFTVTLTAAGWSGNAQTVSNANFKAGAYAYVVSPASGSFGAYSASIVYADNVTQGGKMTFHCGEIPTAALTVNITRIEVEA